MSQSADELCFLPATELAAALQGRDISASEVLETFLTRIERVNPSLNAIVTVVAEQARKRAAELDQLQPDARARPLHGIPIAVKDLTLTRNIRTTMGSPIYRDFVPDIDELFVARLREAGAVVIGKTNTPEFGAGSQTFNTVFGATCNPYDPTKTCGGSSGGAAVALASRMLPLADGSDLGGSLRNPASFCNVVGLRPSPGRVPSWPKQFSSDPLAVHGPMARSVDDVALLLSVMAGPDARVPISLSEPGNTFAQALEADVRGARIAFSPGLGNYAIDPRVSEVLEATLPIFTGLGCSVQHTQPDLAAADDIFRVLRAWMFAAKSRDDYDAHRDKMKDTLVWNIEQGLQLTAADVAAAESKRSQLLGEVAGFFEQHDFLVCAAAQVPPFAIEQEWVEEINGIKMATYLDWMGVCYAITVTGLPAISVPAGFTADGLPVGVQIAARRGEDLALLQFARAFEQATRFADRRPPVQ